MTILLPGISSSAFPALALATAGCISTPPPAGLKPSDVPGQFEMKAPVNAQVAERRLVAGFDSAELTQMVRDGADRESRHQQAAARVLQAQAQRRRSLGSVSRPDGQPERAAEWNAGWRQDDPDQHLQPRR